MRPARSLRDYSLRAAQPERSGWTTTRARSAGSRLAACSRRFPAARGVRSPCTRILTRAIVRTSATRRTCSRRARSFAWSRAKISTWAPPGRLRRMDRTRMARPRRVRAAAEFGGCARPRDGGSAERLHAWAAADPARSANLFGLGLAMRAGEKPTYLYALFKSDDGNLRAYVRAGGPAYAAGLRSGDVVENIDGVPWWQYGTYQSQARAYDGLPHAYDIVRDGRSLAIALGAPFVLERRAMSYDSTAALRSARESLRRLPAGIPRWRDRLRARRSRRSGRALHCRRRRGTGISARLFAERGRPRRRDRA